MEEKGGRMNKVIGYSIILAPLITMLFLMVKSYCGTIRETICMMITSVLVISGVAGCVCLGLYFINK